MVRDKSGTGVDQPRDQRDRDIRYLKADELRLLLNATPLTELGTLERTLYLTAVATGLRRGEFTCTALGGRRL
jgi:hypothetical protein